MDSMRTIDDSMHQMLSVGALTSLGDENKG